MGAGAAAVSDAPLRPQPAAEAHGRRRSPARAPPRPSHSGHTCSSAAGCWQPRGVAETGAGQPGRSSAAWSRPARATSARAGWAPCLTWRCRRPTHGFYDGHVEGGRGSLGLQFAFALPLGLQHAFLHVEATPHRTAARRAARANGAKPTATKTRAATTITIKITSGWRNEGSACSRWTRTACR